MPCPTCDGTLAKLFAEEGRSWSHCSRCGTVTVCLDGTDHRDVYAPALVERCRKFGATLGPAWGALWHRLGIAEAVNVPGERVAPLAPEPPAVTVTEDDGEP